MLVRVGTDAEGGRERQICAIATGLIPALDGGSDRTGNDGEVEQPRDAPLVRDFVLKG